MQRLSTYGLPEINDAIYDFDLQLHNHRVLSKDLPFSMWPKSVPLLCTSALSYSGYTWAIFGKCPWPFLHIPLISVLMERFFHYSCLHREEIFQNVTNTGWRLHQMHCFNAYFRAAALFILSFISERARGNIPTNKIVPSQAPGEVCLSLCAGSSHVAMQQSKQATKICAGINNSVIRTINLSCSSAVTSGWPKILPLK